MHSSQLESRNEGLMGVRPGTPKLRTPFHPARGEAQVRRIRRAANEVLHPWLKEDLTTVLETLPHQRELLATTEQNHAERKS